MRLRYVKGIVRIFNEKGSYEVVASNSMYKEKEVKHRP